MANEEEKQPDRVNPLMAYYTPTLLESLPSTDPAVQRELLEARLGQIHYAAIGRVAAAWAYFEFTIDGWLAKFAGVQDEIGLCFTGQYLGPRARVDCFMALVRHLGARRKWVGKLERFAKNVQGLGDQRNRAVHDVWELSDPSTPHRFEMTARRVVRAIKIHVPTKTLLDLEVKIRELEESLQGIAAEIWDELHPSPETASSDIRP